MEDIFEELAEEVSDHISDVEEAIEVNDRSSGNRKEDGGEARIVQPKRHVTRPRLKLDVPRLIGPRGIPSIKSSFNGIKLKGKGHELDDLNAILFRLQHWTYRLFPKITFEDCVNRVEELGNKKPIMVTMHKLRMGIEEEPNEEDPIHDDDVPQALNPEDDIDAVFNRLVEPRAQASHESAERTVLTEEQRARMMRNRLIAEERRMARLEALKTAKEADELRISVVDVPSEGNNAEPSSNIGSVPSQPSSSMNEDATLMDLLP